MEFTTGFSYFIPTVSTQPTHINSLLRACRTSPRFSKSIQHCVDNNNNNILVLHQRMLLMLISSVYAAGVRQEQDLYIRLIDAATKQVGYATFSLLHNIIREIA